MQTGKIGITDHRDYEMKIELAGETLSRERSGRSRTPRGNCLFRAVLVSRRLDDRQDPRSSSFRLQD